MNNEFPSKGYAIGHNPFSQDRDSLDNSVSPLNDLIGQKVKYTIETYHIITVNLGYRWKTFRFLAYDTQAARGTFIDIQKKVYALSLKHTVWQEYLDDVSALFSNYGLNGYRV